MCIALLPSLYYYNFVKTLTLRIDDSSHRWLTNEAKRLGRTKSQIARQALLQQQNSKKRISLHDRMKEVCGVIKNGPRDLATNPKYMQDFGE
jgi:hypothetical protein